MINDEYALLRQVPTVTRARGFRLYTADGKRLIDLWLNGGAAVLGHTPPNVLRELKNAASRGLYAPFPHFSEGRYIKALANIFPGRVFRLYASPPPELVSLFETGEAALWRPFTDPAFPFAVNEDAPFLVPALPGVQFWRNGLPLGLCVVIANAAAAKSENHLQRLPPGDILSPVLLATAARGLYDILASPERAKPALPRSFRALRENGMWKRQGIYLTLNEKPERRIWESLFQKFFDAGFLLPPTHEFPVILPAELSDGEDAKLAVALG